MSKLKLLLGLSALAALSVVAINSVGASADDVAEGTAVVTTEISATQTGGGHTFTLPAGRVLSCATATFGGTVANGEKTVTATPSYGTCQTKVGETILPAVVNTTGCDYSFSDLTTTAANTYGASTTVGCGEGEAIHITVKNESGTGTLCEYTAAPQGPLSGVHFTDNGDNTINVKATEVSVALTKSFGTVGNCGGASSTSKFNGDTVATLGLALGIDD